MYERMVTDDVLLHYFLANSQSVFSYTQQVTCLDTPTHQQTAPSLPLVVIETTGEKHIQHWSEEHFQIGPVQYQNFAVRVPRRFEHCLPIDSRSVSS